MLFKFNLLESSTENIMRKKEKKNEEVLIVK
jgi:hypothetical protein